MKAQLKTYRKGQPICHPCGNHFGQRKALEGGLVGACLVCGIKTGVAQAVEFNLNRPDLLSGGYVDITLDGEARQMPRSLYARVMRHMMSRLDISIKSIGYESPGSAGGPVSDEDQAKDFIYLAGQREGTDEAQLLDDITWLMTEDGARKILIKAAADCRFERRDVIEARLFQTKNYHKQF